MADAVEQSNNGESNGGKVKPGDGIEVTEQNEVNDGTTNTSAPSSLIPQTSTHKSTSLTTRSTPTSAVASPKPSREASPVRTALKQSAPPAGLRSVTRSRKNSQELSPVRGPAVTASSKPTVPSAAAIQRALSAGTIPSLAPTSQQDGSADLPRLHKANKLVTGTGASSAPRTPRLSSPPPATSSGSNRSVVNATRKPEHSQSTPTTPTIVLERPTRSSTFATDSEIPEEELLPRAGMRTPARGVSASAQPLETVQESSLPATPAISAGRLLQGGKSSVSDRSERIEENPMDEALPNESKSKTESGNESAGSKSIGPKSGDDSKGTRKPVAVNPAKVPTIESRKSYTQLPVKGKAASEGSVKNMTVETETVSSIPQVAVGGGTSERNVPGRTETGGSLRLKPSNETIRPKKEKKKVVRKATSLNAGAGGFLFRRFHHHHIPSIAPLSDSYTFSPIWSPDCVQAQAPVEEVCINSLQSSNCCDSRVKPGSPLDSAFSAKPPDPLRRVSAGLIPFRGRTASSKADIFEAKVASAVDEADSSDSEETFVYESNPPEPLSARPHRFHSRTPSTASTLSQLDHHGTKTRQDGHHSIVGKKSMKFANNYNSINYPKEGEGTVRGPSQNGRGASAHHYHHIGRYGRGSHTSLFDNESPFSSAVKPPRSPTSNPHSTPPRHPQRSPHATRLSGNPRKTEEVLSYDLEGEGADDERAPLVGSTRAGRNRRRPLPGSVRQMYATSDHSRRLCGRITAFTSLFSILALLIAAIVTILILCMKPLYEVEIKDIRNVLVSESEIIFDLHVHAINPNVIAIQISDMDVKLFATSRHVGTSSYRHTHQTPPQNIPILGSSLAPRIRRSNPPRKPQDLLDHLDGIDEGTDPIPDDDPSQDSQRLLLGRVLTFDSPLIFDPSPLHHRPLSAVGEISLSKPGNTTDASGSKRWEHVLLYEFELRVRGVLKYSLPISSGNRTAEVEASVLVKSTEDKGTDNDLAGANGGRPTILLPTVHKALSEAGQAKVD